MNTSDALTKISKMFCHEMALLCTEKVYFEPFLLKKGLLWDENGQKSYRKGLLSSRFWPFFEKNPLF